MLFFKKYVLLLVFVLALVIRLFFPVPYWRSLPYLEDDENGYHLLAVNLIQHHNFGNPWTSSYQPEHHVTPGYPLLIAIVYWMGGVEPRNVAVLQCVLDSLTVLLTYSIVLRLNGSQHAAIIAGILYAIWPPALYYAQHLYVEPILTLIVALTFWLLVRPFRWRAVCLGGACALALYIKSSLTLLPVVSGIVLFMQCLSSETYKKGKKGKVWRLALGQTAIFVVIVIALLAPWCIRNKLMLGRVMFSTLIASNIASGSATYTLAELHGEDIRYMSPRYKYFFDEVVAQAMRENPGWVYVHDPSNYFPLEKLDVLERAAWNIIAAHPGAFLKCHLKGALREWLPERNKSWFMVFTGNLNSGGTFSQLKALILSGRFLDLPKRATATYLFFIAFHIVLLISTVEGTWRLFLQFTLLTFAIVLMILYVMILPGIFPASDRYNLPVMPLMFVLTAFAPEFPGFFKRKKYKTLTTQLPTHEDA
jgi:hypothetical protein